MSMSNDAKIINFAPTEQFSKNKISVCSNSQIYEHFEKKKMIK